MVLKTLCRINVNGNEWKIVRVLWNGRGDGYSYRVYRNRRRFDRSEYQILEQAMLIMWDALYIEVRALDREDKI